MSVCVRVCVCVCVCVCVHVCVCAFDPACGLCCASVSLALSAGGELLVHDVLHMMYSVCRMMYYARYRLCPPDCLSNASYNCTVCVYVCVCVSVCVCVCVCVCV